MKTFIQRSTLCDLTAVQAPSHTFTRQFYLSKNLFYSVKKKLKNKGILQSFKETIECCETFKNTCLEEHMRTAASSYNQGDCEKCLGEWSKFVFEFLQNLYVDDSTLSFQWFEKG